MTGPVSTWSEASAHARAARRLSCSCSSRSSQRRGVVADELGLGALRERREERQVAIAGSSAVSPDASSRSSANSRIVWSIR